MAIKVSGTEVISDDKRILNNESLPDIRPSLLLDFANSKTLDPRITFTRGSTATYWDGKTTAKAEENLFTYSEQFDNSNWTKTRATVTANATTAPDGTTTADSMLQASGQTSGGYVGLNYTQTVGVEYTLSVYAKANAKNFLIIFGNNRNWFNLSAGTIGTVASGHTASMTDVGNGWYRCSVTYTPNITFLAFYVGDSDNSTTVTDSGGIYLWGAQIEQRSSATAYTPTTSSPIVKYQPVLQTAASGEARFDHDPVTGESKGLLIEEARTNLITNSEASNTHWYDQNSLYRNESNQNALGVFNGVVVASAGADWHRIRTNQFPTTDGQDYAATAWIQKGSSSRFRVIFRDDDSSSECRVSATWGSTTLSENNDAGAGTISNSSIVYLTDTIAQVTFVVNKNGNSNFTNVAIGPDSTTSGDTIVALGAQLEAGSFPTSYIPTAGSTVTRSGEGVYVEQAVGGYLSVPDISMYMELETLGIPPSSSYLLTLSNKNYDNRFEFRGQVSAIYANRSVIYANRVATEFFGIGDKSVTAADNIPPNTNYKIAASLTEGSLKACGSDDSTPSETTNSIKGNYNTYWLAIGSSWSVPSNNQWSHHCKKVAIYPKALSSATLQAMTEE